MTPIAQKLRTLAAGMDPMIQAKRHPAIADQNLTPRRIRIAQAMGREANRLGLVKTVLLRLADAHENPELATALEAIHPGVMQMKNRASVSAIPSKELERLAGDALPPPDPKAAIKRMEQDLVGTKIPGFFATPKDEADVMAELLDVRSGHRVLEPSAGKGDLLEAVQRQTAITGVTGYTLTACEISSTLRNILAAKGFTLTPEWDCLGLTGRYDRIIMNPPFERGMDIEHTQYCYTLLAPGGRLVGIVSEGPFFKQDKKSVAFRAWLDDKRVREDLKLESGTFTGADVFRQTGVASRIIVLEAD